MANANCTSHVTSYLVTEKYEQDSSESSLLYRKAQQEEVRTFPVGQVIPYSHDLESKIGVESLGPACAVPITEVYAQIGIECIKLINQDPTILPLCAQKFSLMGIAALKMLIKEGTEHSLSETGEMIEKIWITELNHELDNLDTTSEEKELISQ
jgi:hypothetical protein